MTRDSRIDTIKGVMLAIMLVDHLGGVFKKYTWQPLGYVSAAEGFVVVSGFLCAKVYGRYCDDYKELVARLLKRALVIYRYHVSAILALYLLTMIIPKYRELFSKIFDTFHSNSVKATVLYLSLLYQPDFFCVLPMYIVLLLISPAFLLLMHRGSYSSALVISFAVWILAQYYDPQKYLANYFGYSKTDMFNVFAYQFIFVIGMYLRYCRELLVKFCSNKRAFWSVLSVCLMQAFLRHSRISINYELLNERLSLPAPRMINFCLLLTPFLVLRQKAAGHLSHQLLSIPGQKLPAVFLLTRRHPLRLHPLQLVG
jgi:hypothetical protein